MNSIIFIYFIEIYYEHDLWKSIIIIVKNELQKNYYIHIIYINIRFSNLNKKFDDDSQKMTVIILLCINPGINIRIPITQQYANHKIINISDSVNILVAFNYNVCLHIS